MKKNLMSKYDFSVEHASTGIDYSKVVTVPDQVLSMYDIYMKYAVRGEIAGLANNIGSIVRDDLDDFDESVNFVPEDDLDILQRSHEIRTSRSYSSASVAADSQPDSDPVESSGPDSDSDVDDNSTKPTPKSQKPDANPGDSQRSE